ncbi:MAG TPA: ATP-binding protein, partial [Polyangiales bacterium]|nr:ATP-binding protein [Polyangiales bacterium]
RSMSGGTTTVRAGGPVEAPSSHWRETLLTWALYSAAGLATLAFPVIISQALRHSPIGAFTLFALYVVLLVPALRPRLGFRMRALSLLAGLGLTAVLGFMRVGYQIGPGLGCALVVVLAGLLLGRRALITAFAITWSAILLIGLYQVYSQAALIAPGVLDATRFENWLRAAAVYALFTGVLAAAVMFVIAHIEEVLAERTDALARLRAASAQRREAEAALDDAQRTILQMQKMEAVGRLAGGVAHDFNNALVVILGWADLLRASAGDDERLRGGLDEIVAAGNRAASLTQQLLAFGRKGIHVPRALSLLDVITELARMLQRVLPANIRLQTRVDGDVRAVFADPTQIHQVLLNLCLNARDAMPSGGRLEIHGYNQTFDDTGSQPAGRWVALEVRDTGVGMDAATRARAFEPFFTTKGELGTGLGLSSVYGIVQQTGGHVLLESAPGAGTRCCVLLPPCDGADETSVIQRLDVPPVAPGTILVAEDEQAVRDLMVTTLTTAGHTVLAAEDGSAALELARRYRGKIDLLCTDGVMPGISSATLISDFRLLFPAARVLLCSGHLEQSLRDELPRRELSYLNKPFTGELLTRTVAELLTPSTVP